MHFEGITYRPPLEAQSLLLQVTVGCTHNTCTFCGMYRDVRFRVSKMKEVEDDLIEAREARPQVRRIFLVNGDAFVLSARKLKERAEKIIEYFPECETISMCASIRNIAAKTDQELRELKDLRINDLYVGIESGCGKIVDALKKGYGIDDARAQLKRLNQAGIRYSALLMLGIAGQGQGENNARETAQFLNETKPSKVWVGTLGILEGTPLHNDLRDGTFTQATEREVLLEEKTLIEKLNLEGVHFYGVHPTNLAYIAGVLPEDRPEMTAEIDQFLSETDPKVLDGYALRTDH